MPNSVLELFTYWILAACRSENTIILEEVSDPENDYSYTHEASCAVVDLLEADPDAAMALYFTS